VSNRDFGFRPQVRLNYEFGRLAMNQMHRDRAILTGYNSGDTPVFEQVLDLHDYWDDLHPVIDQAEFRQGRNIRRLTGRLYGSEGQLIQEFENTFDEAGQLMTSHARHEDGTETKFPP